MQLIEPFVRKTEQTGGSHNKPQKFNLSYWSDYWFFIINFNSKGQKDFKQKGDKLASLPITHVTYEKDIIHVL